MEDNVSIPRWECERMLRYLYRAEGYCRKAKSSYDPTVDLMGEPTDTYHGASGYAGATMRDIIQTLESSMS